MTVALIAHPVRQRHYRTLAAPATGARVPHALGRYSRYESRCVAVGAKVTWPKNSRTRVSLACSSRIT